MPCGRMCSHACRRHAKIIATEKSRTPTITATATPKVESPVRVRVSRLSKSVRTCALVVMYVALPCRCGLTLHIAIHIVTNVAVHVTTHHQACWWCTWRVPSHKATCPISFSSCRTRPHVPSPSRPVLQGHMSHLLLVPSHKATIHHTHYHVVRACLAVFPRIRHFRSRHVNARAWPKPMCG